MPEVLCSQCPLRRLPLFLPNNGDEIALVQSLKQRELSVGPEVLLIQEGQSEASLFTLLTGWAFRFKTLSDGRRQILNFLLPGDFIGVQQKMVAVAAHGVMSLTSALLCVFRRDALWELHRQSPTMGFNVTWLSAREESLVDEGLLSVGRRSAEGRISALLILLFKRAAGRQVDGGRGGVPFPLTQQHVADALGLSLVHTNKTMRKLERGGLYRIDHARLHIVDAAKLMSHADIYDRISSQTSTSRPLV